MIKIDSKTKKLIEENPMSLATINDDGTPNVTSINFKK